MVGTMLAPRAYRRFDGSLQRAGAVTERNVTALQSAYWLMMVSGFFEPLLYLLSIGVGVGALIGDIRAARTDARSATRRSWRRRCSRPRR